MKKRKIPACVRTCLWSFDTRKLDVKGHKRLIIEQVLNYGLTPSVKWLLKTYRPSVIKKVIAKPSRGSWFPEVITFWCLMLKIKLPPNIYWKAVIILDPKKCQKLWKKYKVNPFFTT